MPAHEADSQQFITLCRLADWHNEALQRKRVELREQHAARMRELHDRGHVVLGGMLSADDGTPVGSAAIWSVPSASAVHALLRADPWWQGKVWGSVEILPFRVAPHYDLASLRHRSDASIHPRG